MSEDAIVLWVFMIVIAVAMAFLIWWFLGATVI